MKQTQNRTRQFSLIIIFQLLLGIYCNLNSNSVSMQWNLDKWNKTNYCECSSCEYLIKNKTEPSIIKFNVRRKNISFLLQCIISFSNTFEWVQIIFHLLIFRCMEDWETACLGMHYYWL